ILLDFDSHSIHTATSQLYTLSLHDALPISPPISNLKPLRGLDPEAYENLASYCRQDYPEYELIFCVGDENDPSVSVLEKLKHDFPDRQIRILKICRPKETNDKLAKLESMGEETRNTVLLTNSIEDREPQD